VSQQSLERISASLKGISQETWQELVWAKDEPEWVLALRQEAWETYQATPLPTLKDEDWRRTDIRELDLDNVLPFAPAELSVHTESDLPDALRTALATGDSWGGLAVQVNSEAVFVHLADELKAQGVILMPLDQAILKYPNLVQPYFQQIVTPKAGKFPALHGAFFCGGFFCYVPPDTELALPIQMAVWMTKPGIAIFPHVLLVVERGSKAVFVERYSSPTFEQQAFSNPVSEVLVGEGAHLQHVTVQDWGRHVWELGFQRIRVLNDGKLVTVVGSTGGRLVKNYIDYSFPGSGVEALHRGFYFTDGVQHMDYKTFQDHLAPYSTSDLFFKGALRDRSRAVYTGVIHVHKGAKRTDGYQENRNLLLSKHARSDSIPILEIDNDDVRCTHGSATGQVEPEELFYVMSRGLNRKEATRLIVEGFFNQVIEVAPLEGLRHQLQELVSAKLKDLEVDTA